MKIRIASAFAAAALAVGPLALGAGAGAASEAAPTRTVGAEIVKVRSHLVMQGKVSDGYANKLVYIQKKNCKAARCAYHNFAKVRTNSHAKYKHTVPAPRRGAWFWRVKVKASGGFAVSYSSEWKTFRA